MGCDSKPCRQVHYTFDIAFGNDLVLIEGECGQQPDSDGARQIRDQIKDKLLRLFRDVEPACVDGCSCELNEGVIVKTFTRRIPSRRYRISPLDQPVDPNGGCVYELSATVTITRSKREGMCEPSQEAVDDGFKEPVHKGTKPPAKPDGSRSTKPGPQKPKKR